RARVAFCLDTAHLHAAGYDVAAGLEGVWERFDRVVGLSLLKCLHLNDSKSAAGSRVDRHQWIGEGTIGPEAFRRIMRDPPHASERLSAPIHVEAQHATACIALHDELRCTLCHYAGSQIQSQQPRTQLAATAATDGPLPGRGAAPACRPDRRTAPPRGPPSSRS